MTQVTPAPLVVDVLRSRILAGGVGPGSWLRETTVAAELGVSRTPVREALRTLAAEGLVELVPNRGAQVVTWSSEDVDETYRLRALLEGEAAALAARRASEDQVAEVAAAQQRYETSIVSGRPADRAGCNTAFHAAVLAASGSIRLRQLLAVVSSAPMTARAISSYEEQDLQRSVVQHRDILLALQQRDEPLAAAAMRSHLLAARYVAMRASGLQCERVLP